MKPDWLDRHLILGPYFTLCLTPDAYREQVEHIGGSMGDAGPWLNPNGTATTTHLKDKDGRRCCIISMKEWEGKDPVAVAGLLVHEATHVWQRWCLDVGEDSPGAETEAYSIQWISQQLMWDFIRQTGEASATAPQRASRARSRAA